MPSSPSPQTTNAIFGKVFQRIYGIAVSATTCKFYDTPPIEPHEARNRFLCFPVAPLRKIISRKDANVALDSRDDDQNPTDKLVSGSWNKNPPYSVCASDYYSEKEQKNVADFFWWEIFFYDTLTIMRRSCLFQCATGARYDEFLRRMLVRRNGLRREWLAEDVRALRALPERRLEAFIRDGLKVSRNSAINVRDSAYSVPSQLTGSSKEKFCLKREARVTSGTEID